MLDVVLKVGPKTLPETEFQVNARVLIRADLNVPIYNGKVLDTSRIRALNATLDQWRLHPIIVMSHFVRPISDTDPSTSLRQVLSVCQKEWGQEILFASSLDEAKIANVCPGQIMLLENLRYHPGEETNDPSFAKQLAELGDIYVNDAFSCSHRSHASIEAITRFLPSFPGVHFQAEAEPVKQTGVI